MTLLRLQSALSKLPHGSYSLTVRGFACRALKLDANKLTARELGRIRDMMHSTGLPTRRVKSDEAWIDCWDYEVAETGDTKKASRVHGDDE